jgi:hypothetical protein
MKIIRGKTSKATKVVIYGPEGIGKSTLASKFPEPLFIDTEGSTARMDVARLERPTTWSELERQIKAVKAEPDCCKTLVIDTADWAERLCIAEVCTEKRVTGIEDIGYGKGYTYAKEKFSKVLTLLSELTAAGINVVITAHAQMRKFEQPDEMGAYDRWELKLSKQCAPILKEWADMVLFCNYKTTVVKTETGARKAKGAQRIMYTTHNACWDAKNRDGLPDELPMDYESIRSAIEFTPVETQTTDSNPSGVDPEIDPELRALMIRDGISEFDLINIAVTKGWISNGLAPVSSYPEKIIKAFLKGWDKIPAMLKEISDSEAVPFN